MGLVHISSMQRLNEDYFSGEVLFGEGGFSFEDHMETARLDHFFKFSNMKERITKVRLIWFLHQVGAYVHQ